MGDVVSIKNAANAEVRKYLERVIGQALREGANEATITTFLIERESVPAEYAAQVITRVNNRNKFPTLGEGQLQKLGGRDAFRAALGLPPTPKAGTRVEMDYPLTELGDAEFLAHKYRDVLRYDRLRERWLRSDAVSGLWLPQQDEQIVALAGDAIRDRQRLAMKLDDMTLKEEAILWAIKGECRSRLNNMVALAQGLEPLTDDGLHWDENPWLLGCQNGVVDLRTGEFRRGRPEDRVTMRTRAIYDSQATCPLWLAAIDAVFAGHDPEPTPQASDLLDSLAQHAPEPQVNGMAGFMQRALGYSMTGDCREECGFFTWGGGGNGKGTIMNTIGYLAGDYTDDMPYSTLERNSRNGGGIPSDVAKMAGKRFITCSEVNEFTINESRFKALTGRDPMTARFLHKDFFTFTPVGKIWVATNNKPKIVGTDDGIWRRINLIPFTNKFDDSERPNNKKLKDQLREELSGILNWLIEGAKLWYQEGLNRPDVVKAATSDYRQESDGLAAFIEARCVLSGKVQGASIWKEYESYCVAEGVEDLFRLKQKGFFQALAKRFKKVENRDGRAEYHGVGLLAAGSGSSEVQF